MLHANPELSFANFGENLSSFSRQIHETALQKSARYLVAESDLLEAIIEVDKDRTYEKFGLTHLTPYCVKYLKLSEDVAANFVRVARKSIQVPELKEAVATGRITITKAKTIAAVVSPKNQEIWIEKAETLSKEKLEREVAHVLPQSQRPEKAQHKGKDRIRVEFELSEKDMALFRRAQDLVSQKLQRAATLAETQSYLLNYFLDKNDPVRKAERAQTKPHRSRDRFPRKKKSCGVRAKISAEVFHAVNLRDRGRCQVRLPDGSICGQTKWVQLHHLLPVAEGGLDTAENLITICSSHHRTWHSYIT